MKTTYPEANDFIPADWKSIVQKKKIIQPFCAGRKGAVSWAKVCVYIIYVFLML